MTAKKLTKKKLNHFEKLIVELRNKALEEMGYIQDRSINDKANLDYSARDSNYAYHMADVGTDAEEREKSFILFTRENKFIRYLNEALDRLRNGTFGFCIECEELIPEDRLTEVPHTQHCVNCKERNNY